MAVDLETRRRRIAAALRAVMAEPLPTPAIDPAVPSLRESLTRQIDWDEVEETALEEPVDATALPVPPMELSGAMSSTASVALFGHE
jgi:hypothetical protein